MSAQPASSCEVAFRYQNINVSIAGVGRDDHIYRKIQKLGTFYEEDLLEYISRITAADKQGNSIAIDVGANIGNHSIYFGKFVCEHVLSFEANPQVLGILERNLASNQVPSTLQACALGAADGYGEVVLAQNDSQNIGAARIELVDSETPGVENIKIKTLDAVFQEHFSETARIPLLIKIDVEGMELDVLRGATGLLAKHHPHLFIEAPTQQEYRGIADFLRGYGYRVVGNSWASTPVYHFAFEPSMALRARAGVLRYLRYRFKLKQLSSALSRRATS